MFCGFIPFSYVIASEWSNNSSYNILQAPCQTIIHRRFIDLQKARIYVRFCHCSVSEGHQSKFHLDGIHLRPTLSVSTIYLQCTQWVSELCFEPAYYFKNENKIELEISCVLDIR